MLDLPLQGSVLVSCFLSHVVSCREECDLCSHVVSLVRGYGIDIGLIDCLGCVSAHKPEDETKKTYLQS